MEGDRGTSRACWLCGGSGSEQGMMGYVRTPRCECVTQTAVGCGRPATLRVKIKLSFLEIVLG